MDKKFLKVIAENHPGEHGEYTVTLTDPSGRVENQFTITGGDYAFDNFQTFKEKMTGESEDNEMASEVSKTSVDSAVGRLAAKAKSGAGGLAGKFFGTSAQKAKKALKDREKVNKKAIPVFQKATKELEQALTKAAL
jgi:hypothetical protein